MNEDREMVIKALQKLNAQLNADRTFFAVSKVSQAILLIEQAYDELKEKS